MLSLLVLIASRKPRRLKRLKDSADFVVLNAWLSRTANCMKFGTWRMRLVCQEGE
jgi:hypothetical protein